MVPMGMGRFVPELLRPLTERPATKGTDERLGSGVDPLVLIDVALLGEPLRAEVARVRLVVAMNPHVLLKASARLEPSTALLTLVAADQTTLAHVDV